MAINVFCDWGFGLDYHNAARQLDYIKQSLAQNKKHVGFFVGAGCPLSVRVPDAGGGIDATKPLIPDVAGLTAAIAGELRSKNGNAKTSYDKLEQLFVEDERPNYNIEDILSLIRSMHSVAGKGNVRGLGASQLDELDKSICTIISDIVDKPLPAQSTAYTELAVWARSINREKPVHVFTTNYDLLMEEALERASAAYFDGFIGSRKAFFDLAAVENEHLLPARWLRLWKMHGSINWKVVHNDESKATSIVRTDVVEPGQKHLIYPSHLKYDQSRKMPYLAMLDRFKDFLLCPSSVMFMSGYSFSDDHINDTLMSGLKASPSSMVYAFLFGSIDSASYAKARQCAEQTPNLVVAAFDGAIIGRHKAPWQCGVAEIEAHDVFGVLSAKGADSDHGGDSDHDGRVDCQLTLGDFTAFGKVLKSLSGEGLR